MNNQRRMLSARIVSNKAVADLSSDTVRLLFTWLIAHADREGRVHGDPRIVQATIFPYRPEIASEQMGAMLGELHTAQLIWWYKAEGNFWLCLPKWFSHQTGFDRRHEPVSSIPEPPEEWEPECPIDLDAHPEKQAQSVTVEKPPDVPDSLMRLVRQVSTRVRERRVAEAIHLYGLATVRAAVQRSVQYEAHDWAYVEKVLANTDGAPPKPERQSPPADTAAPVYNPVTERWEQLDPVSGKWKRVPEPTDG